MTEKRLSLPAPSETHGRLKILSSDAGQSVAEMPVGPADERYLEFQTANLPPLSQREPRFFYRAEPLFSKLIPVVM